MKQRTSREVYDRIQWDPRMDPGRFTVGYDAHAQGMKEVPYLSFVPDGDIPWHRVWYFREGERIVWDRRTRLDEVFARRGAGAPATPSVRWPTPGYFAPLTPQRFVDGRWSPAELDAATDGAPEIRSPLRVLTWNVLDGANEGDAARTPARVAAIPAVLERAKVDVIALQEVTPALWDALLASPWVRREWWVSDGPDGRAFVPHGVALLSRVPVAWAGEHRFRGAKRALALGLRAGVGPALVVNLHLPSNYTTDAAALRAAWLAELVEQGVASPTLPCVLAGDFNADERELAPVLVPKGFVDAWPAAGDGGAGLTYEPAANPLASLSSRSRLGQRLDRMYLRAGEARVRASAATLHVSGPVIVPDAELLHLSDHWALRCEFEAGDAASERRAWGPRTHRSALVMPLPDGDAARDVDAIRRAHDAGYARWPAHANVLYGFVPEEDFARAREVARAVCERTEPFDVTLAPPTLFEHEGSVTVVLPVEAHPAGALAALEAALVAEFPGCDEQRRHGAYAPHVTVGQFPRERLREAKALVESITAAWGPRRFTVPPLAMLARGDEGPFGVRARLPVGRDARDEALGWLDASCADVLHGANAEAARPVVFAFGSYGLGDRAPGDLDAMALGPDDVAPALFFDAVAEVLARDPAVRDLRVVDDALIPRVAFERAGVKVDLCYARLPAGSRASRPEALRPEDLRAMDPTERRVVEGVLEVAALRRRASATVGLRTYLDALDVVKRWARARGVHGNAWGYLGGVSWALLLAGACEGLGAAETARGLVARFFERYDAWPWPTPAALTVTSYAADPSREPMPVLTTSDPPRNSARNVTPATAAVLREELARARALVDASGDAVPERLFDAPAVEGRAVRATLACDDAASLRACAGWLEGRAVRLVLALEASGCAGVRPTAGLLREGSAVTFEVRCEGGDAGAALAALQRGWEAWAARPAGATFTGSAGTR